MSSCGDERILIVAPVGRDAPLAHETLRKAGVTAQICADIEHLRRELTTGGGGLLLTHEALVPEAAGRLREALESQPPWSDLPIVALVSGAATASTSTHLVTLLGPRANVTLLERPVQAMTLVSAIRAALRARRRQYEVRDHLLARAQAEDAERRARAEAEEAVRMRDEFQASVAHDLKNPLASIKGYAQLLRRQAARAGTPETAKLVGGLDKIDAMVTRVVAQIDELLDLARSHAGRPLHLDLRATDLVALAHRIVADYRQTSPRHRIRVQSTVPELFGVWDPLRLERVLGNMLSNAIKYSPDGGQITVAIRQEEGTAGPWAVLTVRDRGIGIPPEDLPHVFERFYRASNAVGQLPGTGLGLAGARQIVEQHGGTIGVTSEVGRGSTFTVRMPILKAEDGVRDA